jgi:hypothetical protein
MHLYCSNVDHAERSLESIPSAELPEGEAASRFMHRLSESAVEVGMFDADEVKDDGLKLLLSNRSNVLERGSMPAHLPEDKWLARLIQTWSAKGRVSGIAAPQNNEDC